MDTEVAVIGGGLVGMAVALGLQQLGRQVGVFDEGDRAFRASRGNFGLVWVQGKGVGLPDYARWTRQSADLWPAFADELRELAGVNVELSQPSGIDIFLSEAEAEAGVEMLNGLKTALGVITRSNISVTAPRKSWCPKSDRTWLARPIRRWMATSIRSICCARSIRRSRAPGAASKMATRWEGSNRAMAASVLLPATRMPVPGRSSCAPAWATPAWRQWSV